MEKIIDFDRIKKCETIEDLRKLDIKYKENLDFKELIKEDKLIDLRMGNH